MNAPTLRLSPTRSTARVAALSLVLTVFAIDANAQSRNVLVNGQRMTDQQVQFLTQRACTEIPDGAYWLNMQTGAWGYVGNPQVQGVLGDACRQQTNGSGGAFRRGPFATMNRANQEAASYRAQGYRAVAFHNGDGYYVDVRR
jgi:hypothetical protein